MEVTMGATLNRIATLENQNTVLMTDVEEKEVVVAQNSEELDTQKHRNKELTSTLDEVQTKLNRNEEAHKDELRKQQRLVDDLEYSKSSLERRTKSLEDELNAKQTELSGLRISVAELTSSSAGIEAKLKTTQLQLDSARETITELQTLSTDQAQDIKLYADKQRFYETERRQLHNTIQELKGNIRVFCRIRPLVGQEVDKYSGTINHIFVTDEKSLEIVKPADSPNSSNGSKTAAERFNFEFDHVFGHDATQDSVFEEISQLVQSAIDGYNVCIFAYGQTGSGKSLVMGLKMYQIMNNFQLFYQIIQIIFFY
jgi:kinesin family protein C1